MSLSLIGKANGTITAYHDAVVYHFVKGNSYLDRNSNKIGGIFKDVNNEFDYEVNQAQKKITIKSGMAMIYGRQFELPEDESISIDFSFLTGKQYIIIYFELDTRNVTDEKVTLKYAYAGGNYPILNGETNLCENKIGVARLILLQLIYTAGGVEPFSSISKEAYVYEPGVAERARSMDSSGSINGKDITDLINAQYFYNTRHSQRADRTDALGTEDNINAIDDALHLTERDTGLVTIGKGVISVEGVEYKDKPEKANYLNENGDYEFVMDFLELQNKSKVIGIIMEGDLMASEFKFDTLLWPFGWWHDFGTDRGKLGKSFRHDGAGITILDGKLYEEEKEFYIYRITYTQGYSDSWDGNCTIYSDKNLQTCAVMKFIKANGSTPAKLKVHIQDNFRIKCNLKFRFIYLGS